MNPLKNRPSPIGQKYGRLTVISRTANDRFGRTQWNCLCDCGKKHVAALFRMTSKHTKSCGCIRNESNPEACVTGTPEHNSWVGMKQRYFYPAHSEYAYYGGRGIQVCDRWKDSFYKFLADMGPRPEGMSIERNDRDGDYEPSNCRWATKVEQARNRSNNMIVVIGNVSKCVSEWCEILDIPKNRTFQRIYAGWSAHRAFFG